jgi:hypothetical protein
LDNDTRKGGLRCAPRVLVVADVKDFAQRADLLRQPVAPAQMDEERGHLHEDARHVIERSVVALFIGHTADAFNGELGEWGGLFHSAASGKQARASEGRGVTVPEEMPKACCEFRSVISRRSTGAGRLELYTNLLRDTDHGLHVQILKRLPDLRAVNEGKSSGAAGSR